MSSTNLISLLDN